MNTGLWKMDSGLATAPPPGMTVGAAHQSPSTALLTMFFMISLVPP